MDTTVADTQKNKLTKAQKELKKHCLFEARAIQKSRENYYKESTLFDFALEETGLLQSLFSKLDDFQFSMEGITKACLYFITHSNCEIEVKDNLSKELNNLQNFHIGLANYKRLISEKTFYYEELWERLESVAECRECHRVSQSVTECHRVSQSVTECHRVSVNNHTKSRTK